MDNIKAVDKLKDQSTWRLLVLGAITHGVYHAYYIQRQSLKINTIFNNNHKIPESLVKAIIVVSYISLILFVAHFLFPKGHPVQIFNDIIGMGWRIMVLVWVFKARNRLNSAFELTKNDNEWFYGPWTFLFSVLYFNYKINCIYEEQAGQLAPEEVRESGLES